MNIRKLTVGLIVMTMMLSVISGCSKTTDTEGTTNDTGAAKDEMVTLTFMGWEASPLETAAVEKGIELFESTHPNIKVNYTPGLAGAEYNAKLLTAAASKTMPDVMFMMTDAYRTFVSKGILSDLTDHFDSSYPLDDFIQSSKTIMDVDGHVYGVSSCTVSPIVYYNKDVFDAAGLPYPKADPSESWSMDEFREVAKKLTTDEVYGVYGLESPGMVMSAQLLSNGAQRFSDDFSKSTIDSAAAKEVFETIKAIREEDGSAPDATTLESVGMTASQMLQTGKVAMLIDGSWALQELAASAMNIGMAPLPSYGKVLTTGQAHVHSIAAMSPHQEEAWEFVKFLSSIEYQGELVRSGLWMPNRSSMYEPAGVEKWYNEDVHGDSYKLMLTYFRDAAVEPTALQLTSKASDIVTEESSLFFINEQDIATTLKNIDERSNKVLADVLNK